nr:outer dense fiber protein 3 [Hymenolepis microstoma]
MADNNHTEMEMNSSNPDYPYTRPRGPIGAMFSSPGPIYKLPTLVGEKGHDFESTHYKAPAYSFGRRTKINQSGESSPGPAAYAQNPKMTVRGEFSGPSYTLKYRTGKIDTNASPGPARYLPNFDQILPKSPEYKFGLRPDIYNKNSTPGPNAYSLPAPDILSAKPSAPQYSIAGRYGRKHNEMSPGPAEYALGSPDIIKPAAPKYTMGSQLPRPNAADSSPGPAAYDNTKVDYIKPQPPKFSFGILHSPYEGHFIDKHYDDMYDCQ